MNKPSLPAYLWGVVWSMLLTLIGVFLILLYVPTSIRWRDGRLEVVPLWIIGSPGAQTHGIIMFFCHKNAREDEDLVVHECVHIAQAFLGGVFYGCAYVGEFGKFLLFVEPTWKDDMSEPRWYRAYRSISFERTANRIQDEFMRGQRPSAWGAKK